MEFNSSGHPDDIAGAVVWLASSQAVRHSQSLVVDGGYKIAGMR